MALASQYESFRATSNPDALAEDASLHYITSLTSVKDKAAVTKHFFVLAKQVRKKQEKVLTTLESGNVLFQEIETSLEFVTNGGAYLPELNDNLVIDQEATLPISHVVHFDADGKIQQIRLQWDQSSLLKTVGVIGARGGNWPIHDGVEQCKLISSSSAKVSASLEATTKQMADVSITSQSTKKVNPTNDPHTSLDLFPNRKEDEERAGRQAKVATRGNSGPAERPWGDLFVGGDSNESTPTAKRSASPSKENIAPKIGAGKNYHENRLFDFGEEPTKSDAPKIGAGKNYRENRLFDVGEQETDDKTSPSKKEQVYMKPHPQKFNHFDFYDGHDAPAPKPSAPRPNTKHQSQWDFSDFVAPTKPVRNRGQSQGAHHFSFEDDTLQDSPMKKKEPVKPRRDAESHFELQDDGGDPDTMRNTRQNRGVSGAGHNRNESSLWASQQDDGGANDDDTSENISRSSISNPISQKDRNKDFNPHFAMTDDPAIGDAKGSESKPLGTLTNIKDRHKDFDAHWAIDDENPGAIESKYDSSTQNSTGFTRNRDSALKTMSAQWEASDDNPASRGVSENRILHGAGPVENTGIKHGGDGMGGLKGSVRQWGFDDTKAEPTIAPKGGRKDAGLRSDNGWNF